MSVIQPVVYCTLIVGMFRLQLSFAADFFLSPDFELRRFLDLRKTVFKPTAPMVIEVNDGPA